MRFVNTSGGDLDFVLHGTRYQVRPHEAIDVPDRYAYAVGKHGLPLTPDGDVPAMTPAPVKVAPVANVIDDEDGDDPPPFSEPSPPIVIDEPAEEPVADVSDEELEALTAPVPVIEEKTPKKKR